MAVRIEKTFQVQQPMEKVWSFLSDPRKVVVCVPGAQITEQVDDRHYKGSISMKVGPSVSDFRGEIEILRLDPQAHEIEIFGKGQDIRGKGGASMKMTGTLRALPDGGAEVISVSEISVVGILAQVGSRMINEVSNIMFQQFVANFQEQLKAIPDAKSLGAAAAAPPATAPAPKPIKALPLALRALWAAITGLFRRSPKTN
ncbi:MAG TPA: SRPBCC family protein [Candidatus Angelobacter sp.]